MRGILFLFISVGPVSSSFAELAEIQNCSVSPMDRRCVLWNIVDNCLDAASPSQCDADRCRSPLEGNAASCGRSTACKDTTQVWGQPSTEFVTIRGRKMCEATCAPNFVHGLTMPRQLVSGVESPLAAEQRGIWDFAWSNIPWDKTTEVEMALTVNAAYTADPAAQWDPRSQDHLHVHATRLQADARERINALSRKGHADSLNEVWGTVDALDEGLSPGFYGVLVMREAAGEGFSVLVYPDRSPEWDFTIPECPRTP